MFACDSVYTGAIEVPDALMAEVTEKEHASPAECLATIEALSDTDLRILKGFAGLVAFSTWGVPFTADAEDLVHEAIARTLSGRRKWIPKEVDMPTHLRGCIRSIGYEYSKEAKHRSSASMDEYDGHHATEENWEEDLYRESALAGVYTRLRDDVIARDVFEAIRQGFSPAEIRKMLRLEVNDYNAARKRISRQLHGEVNRQHNLKRSR